jgi:transcriptional regulator with XRE-family HTH domain
MKINNKSIKNWLVKIMDEDGISPEELSKAAGISIGTIYNILSGHVDGVQRAIIRKVAAGTGRTFEISGDKVTFYREEKGHEKTNDPITQKILALLDKQPEKRKQLILSIIEDACQLSGDYNGALNEKG